MNTNEQVYYYNSNNAIYLVDKIFLSMHSKEKMSYLVECRLRTIAFTDLLFNSSLPYKYSKAHRLKHRRGIIYIVQSGFSIGIVKNNEVLL